MLMWTKPEMVIVNQCQRFAVHGLMFLMFVRNDRFLVHTFKASLRLMVINMFLSMRKKFCCDVTLLEVVHVHIR